ncbi:MAG: membrane protein insertase YidC [Melioribacteraceae bacterium]|nr:membrane protein insertase YidC [Melioribacteraceae bacterium]
MDKQTTLAFLLIGLVLVVWLYMNAPEPQPIPDVAADSAKVIDTAEALKEKQLAVEEKIIPETEEIPGVFNSADTPEKIITIENDLVKLELTSKGARIRKYYLKEYQTWYYRQIEDTSDFYNRHVQLVNPSDGGDLNLIFVSNEGQLVNTSDINFASNASDYYYRIKGEDSLSLTYTFDTGNNQQIKRHFTFYGDSYSTRFDVELVNMNEVISGLRYDLEWSNGINFVEENSVDEANYANASAYSGGEQVIVDATSSSETETKSLNGAVDWIGVRNKYFAVIIAPEEPSPDGGASFEGRHTEQNGQNIREYYSSTLIVPFEQKDYQKDSFEIYIGPMDYDILKSYGNNFEAFYDFGSFFGLKFITRPISEYILLPLFQFLHMFIPNYGFVIVVFSIIIKFALYPLTRQSYKSMKRMQKLQPKISELKEKYKGDQQRIQKETMKLYQTYGINPAGGCLPMVLQMPILFALFTFFNVAIEIRHEPFMFWITNLSSPDYIITLPFKIPIFGIDKITGLAPLLGITMFLQQKMSVKDPSQKALVYIMPVMFTLMFMGFSSGLNLYYFMFNLLSIIQQYYINNKKDENDELVPVKNPKKKAGFMQRMMEAAEKQAQAQKHQQKKGRK